MAEVFLQNKNDLCYIIIIILCMHGHHCHDLNVRRQHQQILDFVFIAFVSLFCWHIFFIHFTFCIHYLCASQTVAEWQQKELSESYTQRCVTWCKLHYVMNKCFRFSMVLHSSRIGAVFTDGERRNIEQRTDL